MQPTDHMSIPVEYSSNTKITSGALYHLVTTCWVIFLFPKLLVFGKNFYIYFFCSYFFSSSFYSSGFIKPFLFEPCFSILLGISTFISSASKPRLKPKSQI